MADVPQTSESQAYAEAIQDAIERVATASGAGDVGAVLGALISVQAHMISGIADRKTRRTLRVQLDDLLTRMIGEYVEHRAGANIQTIVKKVQ